MYLAESQWFKGGTKIVSFSVSCVVDAGLVRGISLSHYGVISNIDEGMLYVGPRFLKNRYKLPI